MAPTRHKHVPIDEDVHKAFKAYCAGQGRWVYYVGGIVIQAAIDFDLSPERIQRLRGIAKTLGISEDNLIDFFIEYVEHISLQEGLK